eukprot:1152941-Pelagomonas_calceolata.AAC.1
MVHDHIHSTDQSGVISALSAVSYADKGGPADQVTSLHQEQHPWHMARDKGKRANTQRDAPQQKDKRERAH